MGIEPQLFRSLLMLCFLQINTNHSELHHFGEHDCQPVMNLLFVEKSKWFQQLRNQIVISDYFYEFSCPAMCDLRIQLFFIILMSGIRQLNVGSSHIRSKWKWGQSSGLGLSSTLLMLRIRQIEITLNTFLFQ